MARPKDKKSLQLLAIENFEKLQKLIDSLSSEEQQGEFPFEDRDRNIRDILIHLYEWQKMMEKWYTIGMSGEKPVIPREGYTWRTIPEMNIEIWQSYQETSFFEAQELLKESHEKMNQLIAQHTDEELFTKKYYPWTGSTSLGAYLISATSSHYDWALKKVKRYKKTLY